MRKMRNRQRLKPIGLGSCEAFCWFSSGESRECLCFPKQESGTPLWMVAALPSVAGGRTEHEAA